MGEVYRATDSKLGRDVAIKILPETFAFDADRRARFDREARTLAALNHPNIAHIHGLEERDGIVALVMELVEGEDLSAHVARGPIALTDAVPIALQIAAALEAAHEQGIVHRDLKPANVKVRDDGTVKVLDFGLAKAMDPAGASSSGNIMNSPTLTARATAVGMILGTAAYMAPEQARGKATDRRADIWAFGAVLYEMLTGTRAFPGDDLTDTLAAVVRGEPDWTLLPPNLPPTLGVCLRRCLQKDPKQRIPDMATMRLALEGAFETPAAQTTGTVPPRQSGRPFVWASAAIAVASLAVAAFALWSRPEVAPQTSARLTIPLPAGSELTSYPAITPDGRTVAYVAQQGTEDSQLYLRDLNSFEARAVAGTSGARQPFFSPDGKWVAFFAQGFLQKAEVNGGAPIRLVEAAYPFGGTWTEDNKIIYAASLSSGLLQIPAGGGTSHVDLRRLMAPPTATPMSFRRRSPEDAVCCSRSGDRTRRLRCSRWTRQVAASPARTTFAAAMFDPSSGPSGRLLIVDESAGVRSAPFDPATAGPHQCGRDRARQRLLQHRNRGPGMAGGVAWRDRGLCVRQSRENIAGVGQPRRQN